MLITSLILFVVLVPGVCCERPCRAGLYGKLCDKVCDSKCQPRADKITYCDKVTGACLEGCVSGWCGDKCNFPCSNNCIDHVCYQQTGQCAKGCKEKFKGDMCTEYEETPTKGQRDETHKGTIISGISFAVAIVVVCAIFIFTRRCNTLWKCSVNRSGRNNVQGGSNKEHKDSKRLLSKQYLSTEEPKMLTDLLDASYWGDVSRVKGILSEGHVDINCGDDYGRTPLMWATRQNQKEVFDFLVKKGADVSRLDKSGNNLLHAACHGGDKDLVQSVLSRRLVDINSRDKYGRTAVMMAAIGGHGDVFDLLVTRKADLSLVDSADDTVLHAASLGGNVELVEVLLAHKIVNINARNMDDKTAAMLSKEKGHTSVFDLLVSCGCAEN